jgi:galactokinase/galacturonokinase
VRAASADFAAGVTFGLDDIPPAVPGDWGNFLRGAALVLRSAAAAGTGRPPLRGVDLFVAGELPIGGLSSSAAVAVGYLMALNAAAGGPAPEAGGVTAERYAEMVHRVENDYVGLRSGVLDQSMILFARQDRLLHLDCRSGERAYAPFGGAAGSHPDPAAADAARAARAAGGPPAILVAYSGLAQALVGTGYNQRVAECRAAAAGLLEAAGRPVPDGGAVLRDVPVEVYERERGVLPAPLARRAAHYFGEQARVAAGTAAWRAGDRVAFGRLVAESGRSSIDNYECGAPELVTLYEALLDAPGVYGARFSGAGFRGACLALVDPPAFAAAAAAVRDRYLRVYPRYGATFGVFRCASGPPARLLPAPDGPGGAAAGGPA